MANQKLKQIDFFELDRLQKANVYLVNQVGHYDRQQGKCMSSIRELQSFNEARSFVDKPGHLVYCYQKQVDGRLTGEVLMTRKLLSLYDSTQPAQLHKVV